MAANHQWQQGLCSCGPCGNCCYACMCPWCALSTARSKLDSSSCCFNYLCLNAVSMRWLVRSAYQIEGSAWGDCCLSICCLPCVANQVLQTVEAAPRLPLTSPADMRRRWDVPVGKCSCSTCLYSFFCFQCAIASSVNKATGMPWCLAFCCMNLCGARNVVRRQNRIEGNDMLEECLTPVCVYVCASALSTFLGIGPCVYACTCGACTTFLAQMIEEAELKPLPQGAGYLSITAGLINESTVTTTAQGGVVPMVQTNYQPVQQQQYQQPPTRTGFSEIPAGYVYQGVATQFQHPPSKEEYSAAPPQMVYGNAANYQQQPPIVQATVIVSPPASALAASAVEEEAPPPYSEQQIDLPPPPYNHNSTQI